MERYELTELLDRRAQSGRPYLEFQRSPDLSTGLYVLAAGEIDHQQPHTEDEIYYVTRGRATLWTPSAAVQLVPDVFGQPLDTFNAFRLIPEALCYLTHLELAGRVRREPDGERERWRVA